MPLRAILLTIELYCLVTGIDVLLAWIQRDPQLWPRRATHALTEPPQALIRKVLRPQWTGGWDLSPLVVLGVAGALRVWLIQP